MPEERSTNLISCSALGQRWSGYGFRESDSRSRGFQPHSRPGVALATGRPIAPQTGAVATGAFQLEMPRSSRMARATSAWVRGQGLALRIGAGKSATARRAAARSG